jgi:biotin carboxyl carrier protein
VKHSYSIKLGKKTVRATLLERTGPRITFEVSGERYTVEVNPELPHEGAKVLSATATSTVAPAPAPQRSVQQPFSPDRILTPLPGLVASILVTVGQNVEVGAPLAVIEAMKMENTVPAPKSGIIKEVFVAVGQELSLGDALVRIE